MTALDELLSLLEHLPPDETDAAIRAALDPASAEALLYDWPSWARPEQLEPKGQWRWWLIMTGRRWGKTRSASEWVRRRVEDGRARSIAFIAQDPLAARKFMVGDMAGEAGPSSICRISPPGSRPSYAPSTKTLTWPNGAVATVYSAEDPDQIRGGEFDTVWIDELAALKNLKAVLDNVAFAMTRADAFGAPPRGVMSTTPRPLKEIKRLRAADDVKVTTGSLYDNLANLSAGAVAELRKQYEGTRTGRQELHGEVLVDVEGALWRPEDIDANRVLVEPELVYCVVAVDPSASSGPLSSECDIVGVARGVDGDGYVVADQSAVLSPKAWGQRVCDLFWTIGANEVVAEVNNGGEMVKTIIQGCDPRVPVRMVRASVGKMRRAEPVAALYEHNLLHPARMHHVGSFTKLEDQLTSYTGAGGEVSPDRLDALVWGVFAVMLENEVVIV